MVSRFFSGRVDSLPQKIELVISGTTQACYCFNSNLCRVTCANVAMFKNGFHNQSHLLKMVEDRINPGAYILLTIQYPIYLCDHGSKSAVTEPHATDVAFLEDEAERNRIKNSYSKEEIKDMIKNLVEFGWEKETYPYRISEYEKETEVEERAKRLTYNVKLHEDIIEYCKSNQWKPILVGLPYCLELTRSLPTEFIDESFYDCVYKLKDSCKIPFLDYSTDEDLQSVHNYMNIWFLNDRGRDIFTQKLISDMSI